MKERPVEPERGKARLLAGVEKRTRVLPGQADIESNFQLVPRHRRSADTRVVNRAAMPAVDFDWPAQQVPDVLQPIHGHLVQEKLPATRAGDTGLIRRKVSPPPEPGRDIRPMTVEHQGLPPGFEVYLSTNLAITTSMPRGPSQLAAPTIAFDAMKSSSR